MDISDDEPRLRDLLLSARRVAVLGIKTEAHAREPAFYVPQYLVEAGLEVIPVPVYFPDVQTILGRPVYRNVADVPPRIDVVDVFRRSKDVAAHVDDLLQAKPRAVWLQLGIRDDVAAARLSRAGILVVQDRCLMVDHQRYAR
jgi:predicted CoA-binding protein